MLKRFRKWISVLTAFCLAAGLFCGIAPSAYAYKGSDFTSGTLATRLDTIISKGITSDVSPALPAVGGTFSKNQAYTITLPTRSFKAWQCVAYTYAAYNYLFDCDPTGSGSTKISSLVAKNSLSYNDLKSAGVGFGAYLRTTNNSDGTYNGSKGHSVLILAYDSSKIITLDARLVTATEKYKTSINEYTWDNFNKNLLKGVGRYVSQVYQPSTTTSKIISSDEKYFSCDVKIACVEGKIVNLYTNPGDSTKASYFSKGQIARSTYGATLSDGSTWYRITATDNGVDKVFWLKYESSKMTVTEIVQNYTVTFNANGGSVTKSSVTVQSGGTISLPTPTRDGYTFDGWYTTSSGGTKVTSSTKITSNMTLYAHWTKKAAETYKVTFDPNGGNVAPTSATVQSGETISLPTPFRNGGYTFDGWYTSKSGGTKVTSSTKITSNMTIYAHWTENATCTITLDANGGSVSKTSISVKSGNVAAIPLATRTGYSFDGWYTSKSGGTYVTNATTITSDMTLYARWTAKWYTVTFDANGGSVSKSKMSVVYDEKYGELPTPTRSGYTFAGWYTAKSGGTKVTSSSTVEITENTTLYALWTQNGSTSNNTDTSGTTHKLTFDANGGTLYIEGDSITIGLFKISTDSINNKNLETFTLSVSNGGKYGYLPSAKKTNCVFDGWYTAKTGGTKVTTSSTISLSGNQTLYAHWLKWGSWSSWSTKKVSETSTREVETKEVKVSNAHTEYRYYRYLDSTGGHDCWCETYFKSLGKYSGIHLDVSDWTATPYTTSGRDWTCGYCKGSHTGVAYTDAQNRPRWTEYKSPDGQSYYWYETRTVSASYQTQYRYRDLVAE